MRRQTILLAAALAVSMPATAAISKNGDGVSETRHPSSPTGRDRLILMIQEARQVPASVAAVDEAATFGLKRAEPPREVEPEAVESAPLAEPAVKPFAPAVPLGANFATPDMTGYAPHVGLAPVFAFEETRIGRVSLNVGPVETTSYREGEVRLAPRPGDDVYGAEVSGMAVGLSFKLN